MNWVKKECIRLSQEIEKNQTKEFFDFILKYAPDLNSRSSNEDSPNTDYDFGSEKEPQPKGKDCYNCQNCSHNKMCQWKSKIDTDSCDYWECSPSHNQ